MGRLRRWGAIACAVLLIPTSAMSQVDRALLREHTDVFDLYKDLRRFDETYRATREFDLEGYQELIGRSCVRLTDLTKSQSFEDLMYQLEKHAEAHSEDVRAMSQDFKLFLDFLARERTVLKEAGLSETDADHTLGEMLKLRGEMQDRTFSASGTLKDLATLQAHVCRINATVRQKIDANRAMATVGNVTLVILGAGLTVADAAFVTTFPIATAASVVGGAEMLSQGLSNLLNF